MHDVDDHLTELVSIVREVQALPYVWPSPPDAESARRRGVGTCASKHALLAEELEAHEIQSQPMFVVGPLVPAVLADDPEIAPGAHLAEVHECLTVLTQWAGPLRVDVTWDPLLIKRGLAGTLDWEGRTDMMIAVGEGGPCWAIARDGIREAKELLRARLYRKGERDLRDRVLAAMAERFASWRAEGGG